MKRHEPVGVLMLSDVSNVGGAELSMLQSALALHRDHGDTLRIELAVPSNSSILSQAADEGIRINLVPSLKRFRRHLPFEQVGPFLCDAAATQRALSRLILQGGFSIVHGNTSSAALHACLPTRLRKRCLVWHVRDLRPGPENTPLSHLAHRIIVPSIACRDLVNQYAAPEKVRLIPNPIAFAKDSVSDNRRPSGCGPPTIVKVAHLTPWKGHNTFVEALLLLRQRGVPFRALLVGDRPKDELRRQELIALCGATPPPFEFLGIRRDAQELIADSDLLVHCGYPEPFGRVVAESIALGVPVLFWDGHHGPSEIASMMGLDDCAVSPRDAVSLANSIEQALARNFRLSRSKQLTCRRMFSASKHAARLVQEYRALLAQPSPPFPES